MATANLSRVLRHNVVRRPAKEALVDGEQRYTYRELDREVDRTAHALIALGVQPGEIVGVLARNSATYMIEIYAVARIGAVLLPLNWRLHDEELRYIVGHAGVVALLVDEDFHAKAEAVRSVASVRYLVSHEAMAPPGFWLLADLCEEADDGTPVADAEKDLADLQRILYTSGTTSRPKGVMHTHGNVIFNQLGQILELELTSADRTMISAPLFHVSGLEAPGHCTLYAGGTSIITRSFAGRDLVAVATAERVTGLVLAAQLIFDILAMDDLGEFDLDPLRFIIFGGVARIVRERVQAAFPHTRLIDTFGMTELTNGGCYMDARHAWSKVGAQGTPFPHTDIRVVDLDGKELPAGEVGEIVIRGPKVSPGYWRDPEATARAWRDGWFHSGDMASLDPDGFLWFADRKNDMIRSGGENVASAEIERVLADHPDVAEVAVIGVPDDRWEEVPKAFIVQRRDSAVDQATLRDYCLARLAKFKVPRDFEVVDSLPRNDSGKVLKRLLREPDARASASEAAR
jgi:fatty-acyl-CoA synthase